MVQFCCLPSFLLTVTSTKYCPVYVCVAGNITGCDEERSDISNFLYVFILGHSVHAIGGSALYVLSVPYMDSNIRMENTPMYIGW